MHEGEILLGEDTTFAYAGQQVRHRRLCAAAVELTSLCKAWILNASVRDNILFGLPFDRERYHQVVHACALVNDCNIVFHAKCNLQAPDFRLLAAGDQTEVGERGINLSGGQKQRISLARAVYSQQSVLLLDDPLSAVDQHVGQHIFQHCIKGPLLEGFFSSPQPQLPLVSDTAAGRTILLVTHQLQYLPHVDKIVVMKEGQITENGSYDELLRANFDFAALVKENMQQEDENVASEDKTLTSKYRLTLTNTASCSLSLSLSLSLSHTPSDTLALLRSIGVL